MDLEELLNGGLIVASDDSARELGTATRYEPG